MSTNKLDIASDAMIAAIKKRERGLFVRVIQREGIRLTWPQADDIGLDGIEWLVMKIGVRPFPGPGYLTLQPRNG